MIDCPKNFIAAINDVHQGLPRVAREGQPPRGPDYGAFGGAPLDPDVPFEVAHLVENLNAVAHAVANVDQPVIADHHAVHDRQEHSSHASFCLFNRALPAPLAEVVTVLIENNDPPVAITVGNVYIAVARIDEHAGWPVQ